MHTETHRIQRTTLRIIKRLVSTAHVGTQTQTNKPTSMHMHRNINTQANIRFYQLCAPCVSLFRCQYWSYCSTETCLNISVWFKNLGPVFVYIFGVEILTAATAEWKYWNNRNRLGADTHRQPCCAAVLKIECSFTRTRLTERARQRGSVGLYLPVTLCSSVCPILSNSQNDL